jgi:hypothetical protein
MAKSSAITQGDIKSFIARQVRDDVKQLRRELAMQRINVLAALGVGNMKDYAEEWEVDFSNSTTSPKAPQPKNKKLKRITSTKRNVKL